MNDKVVFIADLTEKKIGCVLLQAATGCSREITNLVDPKYWLTSITPNMKSYCIDRDKMELVAEQFNKQDNETNN